ncbi:MAG: hypothetical protein OXC08_20685 [Thiotrichales bacterium]|nr:hypothetical protein [Thiotrichales bacterium]
MFKPKAMKLEWVEQCGPCAGTGLYVGIGERDGAAVVCHQCDGTGRREKVHEYIEFSGQRERDDVRQVYRTGSGFCIAPDVVPGGASYEEWLENPEIVNERGREIRQHVCPAWWCQSAGLWRQKPNWEICIPAGEFSHCINFPKKSECWARFDREAEAPDPATGEPA